MYESNLWTVEPAGTVKASDLDIDPVWVYLDPQLLFPSFS